MPESESLTESSGTRPAIAPFDDDDPSPSPRLTPVREGLPPGYRMRADAHYVDQLDTRMSSIPVRLIDTQSIDTQQHGDAVSPAFIDSVRKFGILQPLLVTARGSRYRVVAGRRRLAAAAAAGLREVPCLVQHVDPEEAEQMALATNLPATRPRPSAPLPSAPMAASAAAQELSQALTALASCADLIASGSPFGRASAADLVRAETRRAMGILSAMRLLRDEVPVARLRATVGSVLDVVAAGGTDANVHVERASKVDARTIHGDPQLLAEAIGDLAAVAASLGDLAGSGRGAARAPLAPITVTASAAGGMITFSVTQRGIEIPAAWLARPFEIAWPVADGTTSLLRLQAARRVAQAHGGDLEIEATADGTVLSLSVPGPA